MKKLFFGFIPFVALLLTGCRSTIMMEDYEDADKFLVGSQTYEGELTELNLFWHFGDVTLIEDESVDYVKVEEENELEDAYKVHSYYRETKLDIRFAAPKVAAVMDKKDKSLTVTYHPGLSNINVNLTSGTFTAETLTATKVNVNLTSGTISNKKITADETKIHFTSGKAVINEVTSSELEVKFTSGNAELDKIDCTNFTGGFSSGTLITRFNTLTKANIKYTSGSTVIKTPVAGAVVSVHKTSGSVNFKVGYTRLDDGRFVIGEGGAEINVNFSSGRTDIY